MRCINCGTIACSSVVILRTQGKYPVTAQSTQLSRRQLLSLAGKPYAKRGVGTPASSEIATSDCPFGQVFLYRNPRFFTVCLGDLKDPGLNPYRCRHLLPSPLWYTSTIVRHIRRMTNPRKFAGYAALVSNRSESLGPTQTAGFLHTNHACSVQASFFRLFV